MNSYIKQKQNPDIENKLMVAKRVIKRGKMNKEYEINRYKLLYVCDLLQFSLIWCLINLDILFLYFFKFLPSMFQFVFSFLFSPLVIVKATNGPRYVVGCRRQVTFYICIVLYNWKKCFQVSYLLFQAPKVTCSDTANY